MKEKIFNEIKKILVILLIVIISIVALSLSSGVNPLVKLYQWCLPLSVPLTFIYNLFIKIATLTFLIFGTIFFYRKGGKK